MATINNRAEKFLDSAKKVYVCSICANPHRMKALTVLLDVAIKQKRIIPRTKMREFIAVETGSRPDRVAFRRHMDNHEPKWTEFIRNP